MSHYRNLYTISFAWVVVFSLTVILTMHGCLSQASYPLIARDSDGFNTLDLSHVLVSDDGYSVTVSDMLATTATIHALMLPDGVTSGSLWMAYGTRGLGHWVSPSVVTANTSHALTSDYATTATYAVTAQSATSANHASLSHDSLLLGGVAANLYALLSDLPTTVTFALTADTATTASYSHRAGAYTITADTTSTLEGLLYAEQTHSLTPLLLDPYSFTTDYDPGPPETHRIFLNYDGRYASLSQSGFLSVADWIRFDSAFDVRHATATLAADTGVNYLTLAADQQFTQHAIDFSTSNSTGVAPLCRLPFEHTLSGSYSKFPSSAATAAAIAPLTAASHAAVTVHAAPAGYVGSLPLSISVQDLTLAAIDGSTSAATGVWPIQRLPFTNSITADFGKVNTAGALYYALAAKADTSAIPAAANPTATLTASLQNGSATTFMRSDAAPALPQALDTAATPQFARMGIGAAADTTNLAYIYGDYYPSASTQAALFAMPVPRLKASRNGLGVPGIIFDESYSGATKGGIFSSWYGNSVAGGLVDGMTFICPRDLDGAYGGILNFGFRFNSQSGSTRMFIDSYSGNVGIGTSAPPSQLTLMGGALEVRETDNGNSAVKLNSNASQGSIDVFVSGILSSHLDPYGNSYLNVTGGNVGIGTTAPGAKLAVQGDVRTSTSLTVGTTASAANFSVTNGGKYIRGTYAVTTVCNWNDTFPKAVATIAANETVVGVYVHFNSLTYSEAGADFYVGDEDDNDGFITVSDTGGTFTGRYGYAASERGDYLAGGDKKNYTAQTTVNAYFANGTGGSATVVVVVENYGL